MSGVSGDDSVFSMTAPWLGLRMARAGGRFRAALVAAGAALGTVVLLITAAVPMTLPQPLSRDNRHFAQIVTVAVALPVVALLAAVMRVSAAVRDRRLAALRILGVDTTTVRAAAGVEAALLAVLGVIAGSVVFLVVRPLLERLDADDRWFHGNALLPNAAGWVTVLVGVLVVCVAVALSSGRSVTAAPVSVRRQGSTARPGWWRFVPLLLGLAVVGWTATRRTRLDQGVPPSVVVGFLVGAALTGLALPLVTAALVRLTADLLLRTSRRPAVVLAARGLQQEPAATTRLIATLLLAVFVVTGARSVLTVFENTPQAVRGHLAATVGPQGATFTANRGQNLDLTALRNIRGVRSITQDVQVPILCAGASSPGDDFSGVCGYGRVARCSDLPGLRIFIDGCRDGRPVWLQEDGLDAAPSPITRTPTLVRLDESDSVSGRFTLDNVTDISHIVGRPDPRDPDWDRSAGPTLLLPPDTPGLDLVLSDQQQYDVVLDGGTATVDRFVAAARAQGLEAYGDDEQADWTLVQGYRTILWTVAGALISVALLALFVTALDRVVARRRLVAALATVGVPIRVSRLSQLLQAVAPMVIGLPLAGLCGLVAGQAYLRLDGQGSAAPWPAVLTATSVSLIGAALMAGLTILGLGRSPTASDLRRE